MGDGDAFLDDLLEGVVVAAPESETVSRSEPAFRVIGSEQLDETPPAQPVRTPPTKAEPVECPPVQIPAVGPRPNHWETNPAFASIAREIADSVNGGPSTATTRTIVSNQPIRPTVILKSRRRRWRFALGTPIEVVFLVLALVVGLAAEYTYVAKGQEPNASSAPVASHLVSDSIRLPAVAVTKVPGSLFEFSSSGSAETYPLHPTTPFAISWTTRCAQLEKPTTMSVVIRPLGRPEANTILTAALPRQPNGQGPVMSAGSYAIVMHAPGSCAWTVQGHRV